MSGILPVLQLGLRAQCARTMPRLFLLAAPCAGIAAAWNAAGTAEEGVRGLADALHQLLPVCALMAAALGCAALRGERGEESLRALLLSPLPRWKLLVGLGGATVLLALVATLLAAGSATVVISTTRAFGDIAPGGLFVTEAAMINAQMRQLGPLLLLLVPVGVFAGLLGATATDDTLIAFLGATLLLFVPALWIPEHGVPWAPYALADHALATLRDLGEGRTEQEATVTAPAYFAHHGVMLLASCATLLFGAVVVFSCRRRA